MAFFSTNAQSIQRNVVVLEIGTGTWCQYCPGASVGADQLIAEGKNVAVIENHNGDPYANTYSNGRNSYYAISGYPTGVFDGIASEVGGAACPSGNIYSTYLSTYNQRYAIPAPVAICMSGTNTGNNYNVNISVTKLNTLAGNNLKLHLVVTESHIIESWQGCMTELNFVNRLMVPDLNGTAVSFASNTTQEVSLNFQTDPSWDLAHCEIVAFLQDNTTKEIYNAIKSPISSIPATTFELNDFAANLTSGCAPLSIDFSTTQAPGTTYTWSFPGGTPSTSTASNPTVVYNTVGVYDVTLTGTDGTCYDSKVKSAYITIHAAPAAPAIPSGESGLCENPANQTYTIPAVAYADFYTWELTPAEAGVATPNGTSCSVDWSATWTGTAHLRAKADNACGTGNWSNAKEITINLIPVQCPAPTGPLTLCENAPTTQYSTLGVTPATGYNWELIPASAGTFYQGSSEVDINWADNFTGTATLRVLAINVSCVGAFSDPITITVSDNPAAQNVTGGGTFCGPSGGGVAVNLSSSEANTTYTLIKDGVPTSTVINGTGNAISFGNQTVAGTYTASASNTSGCSASMTGNSVVLVDPQAPEKPSDPQGPAVIITSSTPTSEFVSSSVYASSYSWEISPAQAGTIEGNDESAVITWNQAYIGTSTIKVQGINTCGSSTYSNEATTTVNLGVGVPESNPSAFSIAPNPASNSFTIYSAKETICNLSIVNNLGSVVQTRPNIKLGKETSIDISNLSSGIYSVVLRTTQGTSTIKLIVEK